MPAITQVFTVGHPRTAVWEKFQDIDSVVQCLPGASLTEPVKDGTAKGRVTVKLGPVKADFGGEAEITADEATHAGSIAGKGIDKSHNSRAKGTVTYRLEEVDGGAGTRVTVEVDYTLSGSLAQFARGGIVEAVAAQICNDFVANLEADLSTGGVPAGEPAAPTAGTEAPAAPPPRKQSELNLLAVLWSAFRKRIARLFGRG